MSAIIQPGEHPFPSGLPWPIGGLSVRLDDIAASTGLTIETWEEDGLGTARGGLIKLPSGRIVRLREMVHRVKHYGKRGPDIDADGAEIVSIGIGALCAELLMALNLPETAIDWRMDEVDTKHVAEILAVIARKRVAMLRIPVDCNHREGHRLRIIISPLEGISEEQLKVGERVILFEPGMECEAILQRGERPPWVADIIEETIKEVPYNNRSS